MMLFDEFVERRDSELTAKYQRSNDFEHLTIDEFNESEYEEYVLAFVRAMPQCYELPSDYVVSETLPDSLIMESEIPF